MRVLKAFGVAAVLLLGGGVHIDGQQLPTDINGWRAARWGMSASQLLAAFPGEARVLTKPESFDFTKTGGGKFVAPIGIDSFDLSGIPVIVRFLFPEDSARLAAVILQRLDTSATSGSESDYVRLAALLTERYGQRSFGHDEKPRRERETVRLEASWFFKRTTIELQYMYLPSIVEVLTLIYRVPSKSKL